MLDILSGIDPEKLDSDEIALIFAIDTLCDMQRRSLIRGPDIVLNRGLIRGVVEQLVDLGKEPPKEAVQWAAKSLIVHVNGAGGIDQFLDGSYLNLLPKKKRNKLR